MASIVRMPAALAGVTEAAIQSWMVAPGAAVSVGTPIAELETEKAVVEYESEVAGTVGRLLADAGDNVTVGEPIAVLLAEGEGEDAIDAALREVGYAAAAAPQPAAAPAPTVAAAPAAETAPTQAPATSAPVETAVSATGGRLFASPLVRRLAKERGVDLASVTGTGPSGRVTRRDLDRVPAVPEAAAPSAPASVAAPPVASAAAGYEDVPHSGMRRAIARRLTESKSTVPHFYLVADCRVDALLALRAQVNAASDSKVSVNDFVLKAVALALVDVPEANVIWTDEATRRFSSVDLSVAVSIEGGLVTPVVRGVEGLSLSQLSATVVDLAERARAGRLKQNELEGGSFAVSNLGMYGTTEFSAILNPPQSGILAVGRAVPKPVVIDGELAVGTVMTVTLSADHRVLDGALAAQWLAAFQRRIENPLSILI
jgi:pyruvate dehydrogenase E2 component (dihydrolipoamide acetyltransferase)